MKQKISIALAIFAMLATLQTAEARKVVLATKTSLNQLKAICDSMGGSFWSNANGYSCVKSNCDGKGNSCTVFCDADGNCEGYVPKIVPTQNKDLRSILSPSTSAKQ